MIPSASADGTALTILHARKSSSFSGWNQYGNGGKYAEIMQTPRLLVGVISAAFLAVFADNFLLTVCVPVFPNYYNGVYDALAIGSLYATKSAVQLLFNPCVKFVIDRRGPRLPLTFGVASLIAAAICFSYAFSTKEADVSYSIASVGALLHGLASACITHSCISLVALTHASEYRSRALKVLISGVATGLLLGSPIGGLCYKYINPWSAFMITALLVVVSLLVQFLLFSGGYIVYITENDNDDEISVSLFPLGRMQQGNVMHDEDYVEAAPGICALYTNRYVLIAFVSSLVGSFTLGMLQPLLPLYLEREFLLGVLHQSIVYASAILFYLLGICFIDIFLVQNVPKYRCMIYGLIILGCGMCAMLAATSITVTLLCVFVIGLGLAFLETPALPLLADIIEVRCHIDVRF